MQHDLIKRIILEQHEVIRRTEIIPRTIPLSSEINQVLTGIRRAGKSTLLYSLVKRLVADGISWMRIIYINFEDERIKAITVDQLHLIGEAHAELFPEFAQEKIWYFLDELQNVKGWEAYARRLVDSPKVQLCLTGSSSKLLSEEIATAMRGRSVPLEVFPLSFGEYLRFNSVLKKPLSAGVYTSAQKGMLRNAMERYFNVGGFPAVQDMPEAATSWR